MVGNEFENSLVPITGRADHHDACGSTICVGSVVLSPREVLSLMVAMSEVFRPSGRSSTLVELGVDVTETVMVSFDHC